MQTPDFTNPFANPVFAKLIVRLLLLFAGSFIVLLVIARGNVDRLMHSNVGARFFGWLMLSPLYLVGVFTGRLPGFFMILGFMSLALFEFTKIAKLPINYFGALILLALWSVITGAFFPQYFYSLPLIYFTVIGLVAISSNKPDQAFNHASVSLYGAIWIIFSLSHIVLLSRFNNTIDHTRSLLFLVVFAVGLADIGGYLFGKLFEKINFFTKYKVADKISPNKTYAGTLGYIIGAGTAVLILRFSLPTSLSLYKLVGAAILIGVFSFMGGMTHSFFKRYYNVKDSGNLIPGHGGVLDRIDSMSRVMVVIYYYFLLVL